MKRLAAPLALLALALSTSTQAAETVDLHELTWWVHVDLTDQGTGSQPLSYYEAMIATAMREASDLVSGGQGPFDGPCCSRLETVQVNVFGTSGDGLDVPSSAADYATMDAVAGFSGSHAFLVDSLAWCNGPTTTAIGCGDTPACSGDPDDDPFLVLHVTLEAWDAGALAQSVAHERGHNACLVHVAANGCQVMQAAAGGGCLTASECDHYRDGRTGTGGACECHADAATFEPDGTACVEDTPGVCSGGLCGGFDQDAAVRLVAAGGYESLAGAATDDALVGAAAAGGFSAAIPVGMSAAPRGLAYADDRNVVFAVAPGAGDDELHVLDPLAGTWVQTVGVISGIQGLIALAYDPGPTDDPADDRLFALKDDASSFEDLIEIDPDDASAVNRGGLNLGLSSGFQGMAFDPGTGLLYLASAAGLFSLDPATCPPGSCTVSALPATSVARTTPGLAYSARTGRVYMVGNQFGNQRTLYDSIDPATWSVTHETIHVDGFTTGGLAAPPIELAACWNGDDDDSDGDADFPDDVGCRDEAWYIEDPECSDGIDNDGATGIDWDGAGTGVEDPNCQGLPWRNKEASGCGFGPELALVLPWVALLRRRRA